MASQCNAICFNCNEFLPGIIFILKLMMCEPYFITYTLCLYPKIYSVQYLKSGPGKVRPGHISISQVRPGCKKIGNHCSRGSMERRDLSR